MKLLSWFACAGLLACVALAGPLDRWDWLYPQPTGLSLLGVTYGNGQFVAVGQGVIVRSTNGVDWILARELPTTNLNAIASGNGVFVAVGQAGRIITSTDAVTWTPRASAPYDLLSVAYGSGRFVSVGGDYSTNWIQTSTDGAMWSPVAGVPPEPFSGWATLRDVTYGERFIAVSQKFSILHSTNGLNWERTTNVPPNYYELQGLTYGGDRYVVVGPYTVLYSTNGTRWVSAGSLFGHYHSDVAHGNGRFVVVGNTGLAGHSTNGLNWTGLPHIGSSELTDITYGAGRFVAVGHRGLILSSLTGTNWSAGNGPTWSSGLSCSSEGCIANDYQGVLRATTNFVDWTFAATNLQTDRLKYLNGCFVAPARDGVIHIGRGLHDWSSVTTALTNELTDAAYGAGRYVVSGFRGALLNSSNALNWNVVSTGWTNDLPYLAFGNGRFVAHNYWGDVAVSTNGADWTLMPAVSPVRGGSKLTFGNGLFVSINSTGMISRSVDGVAWFRAHLQTNANLTEIIFAHGLLLIGGYSDGQTFLLASRDGTNWSRHVVPHLRYIESLAAYRGRIVANSTPLFLQSGLFPSLAIQLGSPPQLSLTGFEGSYQIEAADEISGSWTTITNLPAGQSISLPAGGGLRFFRALGPSP